MAKDKVIKAVRFLEGRLAASGLNISKIVLFGSHAAGRAMEGSDIDIAVVSGDFRDKDIFERVGLLKEAEIATIKKFMVPLDVIAMTPEEFSGGTSLVADYARKGTIVHAA